MVDRDRDQLVKRLEENGQSRVPPPITQAFPVEVSDEFGDRRGATIVALNEPSRATLDFFPIGQNRAGCTGPKQLLRTQGVV